MGTKILHILKTVPDETTRRLVSALSEPYGEDATVIQLDDSTDYDKLIELVFSHDKVISWW
ncbi:MAG: hypothetical protein DRH37_03890 [Deltaproteobacteria bacterium]|nr:MAG: hypothetical protein DRH37_03890 [Deltaproteobacteria bacterium]